MKLSFFSLLLIIVGLFFNIQVHAQNETSVRNNIANNLPDNQTKLITPNILRQTFNFLLDYSAKKADSTRVNNLLFNKADKTDVTAKLTLKADASLVNLKVNNTVFNDSLASVRGRFSTKAPISSPKFEGDVELNSIGNGVIIKSPNGTRFRLTISNNGDIIATSL